MLNDLTDEELERYAILVVFINRRLECGERVIVLINAMSYECITDNLTNELSDAFRNNSWTVTVRRYCNTASMYFSKNMPKPTDNKPADMRTPI